MKDIGNVSKISFDGLDCPIHEKDSSMEWYIKQSDLCPIDA
jgi:hypothetical protein